MKSDGTSPKAIRGYAPNRSARDRLVASGLTLRQIYEAEKDQTWPRIRMRRGEFLGVVDGLSAFGKTKRPALAAVKHFHGDGATILDVETGKDSRTHGPEMLDEVIRPAKPSVAYLKLLRDERLDARREKNGQMKKHDAYRIWHIPGMLIEEKVEITRWSRASLYAEFKKTGAPAGRRPKQLIEV